MPLSKRYRSDKKIGVKLLNCMMETDTLDALIESIHGHKYCQVFGNKDFFVEAYPIENRSDCHKELDRFVRYYRASDLM